MKNSIPLILSVVLGLAAVFAVSRMMSGQDEDKGGKTVSVVVAAHGLAANAPLEEGALSFVEMPASAVPHGALLWSNVAIAYGQRPQRDIDPGDYLMISDIRSRLTLADCARDGEWTIPVTFADGALVSMLMPDDEIAILASYSANADSLSKSLAGATNMTELAALAVAAEREGSKTTVVLLPCVRVIGLGGNGGDFRSMNAPGTGTSTIFVSLPPQQAAALVAAQQFAELHPVLRRRNDKSALSREAGGIVTPKTFENMSKKLTQVEIPSVPTQQ